MENREIEIERILTSEAYSIINDIILIVKHYYGQNVLEADIDFQKKYEMNYVFTTLCAKYTTLPYRVIGILINKKNPQFNLRRLKKGYIYENAFTEVDKLFKNMILNK